MTVTNQDISIYRGDAADIVVSLTDDVGNPFDPTTASDIRYRVATSPHAETALIAKDMSSGIAAIEGGISITLDTADTTIDADVYYHELKVYGSILGAIETAMTGSFIVRRSLTMGKQTQAQISLAGNSTLDANLALPPV